MVVDEPAEAWILDQLEVILVQPAGLGVPSAAIVVSDGTIGGSYFRPEAQLGPFASWAAACQEAQRRATALPGYRVEYCDPSIPDESQEDDWSDGDDDSFT